MKSYVTHPFTQPFLVRYKGCISSSVNSIYWYPLKTWASSFIQHKNLHSVHSIFFLFCPVSGVLDLCVRKANGRKAAQTKAEGDGYGNFASIGKAAGTISAPQGMQEEGGKWIAKLQRYCCTLWLAQQSTRQELSASGTRLCLIFMPSYHTFSTHPVYFTDTADHAHGRGKLGNALIRYRARHRQLGQHPGLSGKWPQLLLLAVKLSCFSVASGMLSCVEKWLCLRSTKPETAGVSPATVQWTNARVGMIKASQKIPTLYGTKQRLSEFITLSTIIPQQCWF